MLVELRFETQSSIREISEPSKVLVGSIIYVDKKAYHLKQVSSKGNELPVATLENPFPEMTDLLTKMQRRYADLTKGMSDDKYASLIRQRFHEIAGAAETEGYVPQTTIPDPGTKDTGGSLQLNQNEAEEIQRLIIFLRKKAEEPGQLSSAEMQPIVTQKITVG